MCCFLVPLAQAVVVTALGQTGGGAVMLREILTVGVPMALALTLVWAAWAMWKERRAARTAA